MKSCYYCEYCRKKYTGRERVSCAIRDKMVRKRAAKQCENYTVGDK